MQTGLQNISPSQHSARFNGRIVIVTGELSGEIHGEHLVYALRESLEAQFSGIGSERLRKAGVEVIFDYRTISVTGLSEVFTKLPRIREAYSTIKRHLVETRPSLLILVDFPGFNMRVARFAHRAGIPVVYFIPPQVWAWRKGRIAAIREAVERVITILPFEKQLYDDHDVDAVYVGNPLAAIAKPSLPAHVFLAGLAIDPGTCCITMMPGSRRNEIERHMPILMETGDLLKNELGDVRLLIPIAEHVEAGFVERFVDGRPWVVPFRGLSYDALAASSLAFIASGTATLEAALIGTPSIVIYKVSALSYLAARMLVKVDYISLPNLIAGQEVFPEFIQRIDPKILAEKGLHVLQNDQTKTRTAMDGIRNNLMGRDAYRLASGAVMEVLERLYGPLL